MISLIIPSYKNPEYLELCIDTAEATANKKVDYEIVVVIDGFVDMYEELFKKYEGVPSVKFLKLQQNSGLSYALNVGVWKCSGDKIVVINEDNVVGEGWNSILTGLFDENVVYTINQIEPGIDVPVGFNFVKRNFGGNVDEFDFDGFRNFEMDIREDREDDVGYLFPFLMSKTQYMIVGGFDIWYQSPHICDLDFWTKLELNGISFKRTYQMHFYHFGQKSTKKREDDPTAEKKFLEKENKAATQYLYKWGWSPQRGNVNQTVPSNRDQINGIKL